MTVPALRFHNISKTYAGAAMDALSAFTLDIEPGDVQLLCFDGLTEMVGDDFLAAVLREEQSPQRSCERLVAETHEKSANRQSAGAHGVATWIGGCLDPTNAAADHRTGLRSRPRLGCTRRRA